MLLGYWVNTSMNSAPCLAGISDITPVCASIKAETGWCWKHVGALLHESQSAPKPHQSPTLAFIYTWAIFGLWQIGPIYVTILQNFLPFHGSLWKYQWSVEFGPRCQCRAGTECSLCCKIKTVLARMCTCVCRTGKNHFTKFPILLQNPAASRN